jgi:hypothetical protein
MRNDWTFTCFVHVVPFFVLSHEKIFPKIAILTVIDQFGPIPFSDVPFCSETPLPAYQFVLIELSE